MRPRHPLPRLWLMTDERQGDALWAALARLPRGSGVILRHRSLPRHQRRHLFEAVRRVARGRALVLLLAGEVRDARAWKADGVHGRTARRTPGLIVSRPAHDARELAAAARAGADLAFLSPVFATRSHPGAPALGRVRFGLLLRRATIPVAAVGGMDARRARTLPPGTRGWAAIDAWSGIGRVPKR